MVDEQFYQAKNKWDTTKDQEKQQQQQQQTNNKKHKQTNSH